MHPDHLDVTGDARRQGADPREFLDSARPFGAGPNSLGEHDYRDETNKPGGPAVRFTTDGTRYPP